MRTGQDAIRLLEYAEPCTDAAVARLETLARPRRDASLWSDLAGAYYVRAQRKDQAEDLVRSLDAAEQAVKLAPQNGDARFNRALALESLGLAEEALHAWESSQRGLPAPWAAESTQHWSRLTRERTLSAAIQWPLNLKRLPDAVRSDDQAAVLELVRPYRAAALRYVEETVLPAWAAAASAGSTREAAEQLALARMIAVALATLTGDRYLLDSVEQIRNSPNATLEQGCLALQAARSAGRDMKSEKAGVRYREAEDAFRRAGSPLRFAAALDRGTAMVFAHDYEGARALFRQLEREAGHHNYQYLLARIHANRGFCYYVESRFLDSLAEYGHAEAIFERTKDDDNLSNVHSRMSGIFRRIGHEPSTWRSLFKAQRQASTMLDPQARHLLLGESALSAVELGYPSVGLLYQQAAVALIEDQLAHNTDESRVTNLRDNLGVALRGRAGIRVRLGDYAGARDDLDRALPLMKAQLDPPSSAILSGFRARLAEVQAQTLAATDRKKAIAALDEAISYASRTHYRSLVASLLLQRSELHLLQRDRSAALSDLRIAVTALHDEQRTVLPGGPALQGGQERLWSAYFARSQEAYRRLIRLLTEDGADREAFDYAEQARAYEPLRLLLQRGDLPRDFQARIHNQEPLRLADVESLLPAGTFLLQYVVLDDRTYVWLVRTGHSERMTLSVGEPQIAQWTAALQRFASVRDTENFNSALESPYAGLLAAPLAKIAQLHKSEEPATVVFVPDRSMHGLPFAALRNGTRYVIQDHTVAIAASATLYAYSLAQDRQQSMTGQESVLLFADPAFDQQMDVARGLQPLHGAIKEMERIARIYEPEVMVKRRSREAATVPEFLKLARNSSVIHIAVHGIANPDEPSRSFFLFAPADADSGALDAERLLKQLYIDKPRLAVLSACSSAGGAPVGPEGLAPLVRPMLAAGVPGVVGTLWNVSDNPATVELLVKFHRHYRDGSNADDALRLAQKEMLEDPDLERSSAMAWAPFQIIGFASSPFQTRARPKRR